MAPDILSGLLLVFTLTAILAALFFVVDGRTLHGGLAHVLLVAGFVIGLSPAFSLPVPGAGFAHVLLAVAILFGVAIVCRPRGLLYPLVGAGLAGVWFLVTERVPFYGLAMSPWVLCLGSLGAGAVAWLLVTREAERRTHHKELTDRLEAPSREGDGTVSTPRLYAGPTMAWRVRETARAAFFLGFLPVLVGADVLHLVLGFEWFQASSVALGGDYIVGGAGLGDALIVGPAYANLGAFACLFVQHGRRVLPQGVRA